MVQSPQKTCFMSYWHWISCLCKIQSTAALKHWNSQLHWRNWSWLWYLNLCTVWTWFEVMCRLDIFKKPFLKGRRKDDRSHDELRRRWFRGERLVIEVFGWWMTLNGWKHLSFLSVRLPLDQGFHQVKTYSLWCAFLMLTGLLYLS